MDSTGAPYHEKRDASKAAKLQDTTQIKVPIPQIASHQHPRSSKAATHMLLSMVGAVAQMHPGYLAWDEREEQTFGWLLDDRQHAKDLLYQRGKGIDTCRQ